MLRLNNTIYQLLVIGIVVVAVFSPTLFGGYCPIDDYDMINGVKNVTNLSLYSIFMPKLNEGLYYRPLIALSYHIDNILFALDPFYLHLHNILLHLCNSILLFFIARSVMKNVGRDNSTSLLPLAISLLFAFHPIVTESVNWISGRTDLLAGTFILLSTLFCLRFLMGLGRYNVAISISGALGAILAKETALAFVPCLFMLLVSENIKTEMSTNRRLDYRKILYVIFACILVYLAFLFVRSVAISSDSMRIGMTLKFLMSDPLHYFMVFLRAFGFYIKKMVIPYPSNFAILDIDPLYELLAIPMVIGCCYILTRLSIYSTIFTVSIIMFLPALIIATNQIAWTPYAERYLYISSAYFVLATVLWIHKFHGNSYSNLKRTGAILVLILMGSYTFQRNMVWSSPYLLCQDTLLKSPDSKDIRVVYGSLLAKSGDYSGALQQFWLARAIPSFGYDERIDLGVSYVYEKNGEVDKAIRLLRKAVERTNRRSIKPMAALDELLNKRLQCSENSDEMMRIGKEIIGLQRDMYVLDRDSSHVYRIANVSERIGFKKEVNQLLRQTEIAVESQDDLSDAAGSKRTKPLMEIND